MNCKENYISQEYSSNLLYDILSKMEKSNNNINQLRTDFNALKLCSIKYSFGIIKSSEHKNTKDAVGMSLYTLAYSSIQITILHYTDKYRLRLY